MPQCLPHQYTSMAFVETGSFHSYCAHCVPFSGAVPNASCAGSAELPGVAPLFSEVRRVSADTYEPLGVATMARLSGFAESVAANVAVGASAIAAAPPAA